jgi:hypothetical protein
MIQRSDMWFLSSGFGDGHRMASDPCFPRCLVVKPTGSKTRYAPRKSAAAGFPVSSIAG